MKSVSVEHNRTLLDEVVDSSQTVELLFESALANGESIDYSPPAGSTVLVSLPPESPKINARIPLPEFESKEYLLVEKGQNVQDMILQGMGTINTLFDVCLLNGISITEALYPGEELQLSNEGILPEVVSDFKQKRIKVATGNKEEIYPDYHYSVGSYVEENYWE